MFQENILLSRYSNYKIGGPARYFFEAKTIDELIEAAETAAKKKLPVFILGAGTNILFSDKGFNGLIIRPNIQFIEKEGNILRVGAGVSMVQLLDYLIAQSLSGLEWAGGLPGTVGGAIWGNAGAFGGQIKTAVKQVVSLDILGPKAKLIKKNASACNFSYRSSVFKLNTKEIIVETNLIFKKEDKKLIRELVEENIDYRQKRQPLEHPSIGSIFKNVNLKKMAKNQRQNFASVIKNDPFPVIPAAHLISEAGLKGISYGGAMISPKHPNFIVNVLDATSGDVQNLI